MKCNHRKKKKNKSLKHAYAYALYLYRAYPSLVSWQEIKMSNICRGDNLTGRILTRGPSLVATSLFFNHPSKFDGMSPTIEYKMKKKIPKTIIPKAFPHTEGEVIITIEATIPNTTTTANQALQAINKVINESTDITKPPFIFTYITNNNRLVLTSNSTTKVTTYAPYLQIITNTTKDLKLSETQINEY
jgi:hypothetical protein